MLTNFYIDAFNVYYGCLKGTAYKWLNLEALCQLSFPSDQVHRIRYFTARVKARPSDPQQPVRQAAYLRALATLPSVSTERKTGRESFQRSPVLSGRVLLPGAECQLAPSSSQI